MSIAPAADIVHVWTDAGAPARLVWAGRRFRVVAAVELHQHSPLEEARSTGWALVVVAEADPAEVRALQVQPGTGDTWCVVDTDSA
ncbi:hypothetical protein ACIRCZ_18520 [Leifsonia sp. NPDC102414]|uniref:hypothetical protein n=1 Tax=Leifsonia sp. NPDC102414 TaxID=3364124 RepID=UPI00381F830E